MRSILIILTTLFILVMGTGVAYSCKRLPQGIQENKNYEIYISREGTSFQVKVTKIDTANCWLTGKFITNSNEVFIYIDDILAISENITRR